MTFDVTYDAFQRSITFKISWQLTFRAVCWLFFVNDFTVLSIHPNEISPHLIKIVRSE